MPTMVTDHNANALQLLRQEVLGMRARLNTLTPYAMQMPMVAAANVATEAQMAIERYMIAKRRELRGLFDRFLASLNALAPTPDNVWQTQRRYAHLKLYFQAVLSQFDIFADVLVQRSQHGMGVWLAGMDAAASDGLRLGRRYFEAPPVICYVDRGHGAAIRRARTRLPGGGSSPVAVIRMPRERMVGTGIAASLFHEVGHQAAAQLDLVNPLRQLLKQRRRMARQHPRAWQVWERCISEIVADLWSVSRAGISATLGVMSVVSLPRAFVFRVNLDDPHPAPWIRVMLSAAMGDALYPHPQWARLQRMWLTMYPKQLMSAEQRQLFGEMEASMPEFVALLLAFRPASLQGKSLGETLRLPDRRPEYLQALWAQWKADQDRLKRAPPALAFAVLGQARASGLLGAKQELDLIGSLLGHWALRSYLPEEGVAAIPQAAAA